MPVIRPTGNIIRLILRDGEAIQRLPRLVGAGIAKELILGGRTDKRAKSI